MLLDGHKYNSGSPDVLVADVVFNKRPKFFIKQSEGTTNTFYSLVDETGNNISTELFDSAGITELKSRYGDPDEKKLLFSNPSLDYDKKILECFDKDGPAISCQKYQYKDGKYSIIESMEPIYTNTVVIGKYTSYLANGAVKILIANYEADEKIIVTAKKKLGLLQQPEAASKPQGSLDSGKVAIVVDAVHTEYGNIWLKVTTTQDNSTGWLKESEDFIIQSVKL